MPPDATYRPTLKRALVQTGFAVVLAKNAWRDWWNARRKARP
jgi:hypothetical protein